MDKLIKITEHRFKEWLAMKLAAKREVRTPVGLIDLLTDTELIEVKFARGWKEALGQVMAYSVFYPDRVKRIYLLGENPVQVVNEVCKQYGVEVTWDDRMYMPDSVGSSPEKPLRVKENFNAGVAVDHLNERLKRVGSRVTLGYGGVAGKVYLQGLLPTKPGSSTRQSRLKIPVGVYPNSVGLEVAFQMALRVNGLLLANKFDWSEIEEYRKYSS